MSLHFHYPEKKENNMSSMFTLEKRTHITYDGKKIAGDDHKGGKLLLGPAGAQIPIAQAIALGLVSSEKKESPKPSAKKESSPKKEAAK